MFFRAAFLCTCAALSLIAQQQIRPVPPPGVAVPDKDRADLETGLKQLKASLDRLEGVALAPDVQIFHDAVRYALTYNEFFRPEEIGRAKELLKQGQARADELSQGRAQWPAATGLVVRGYVSKIDGSVQPYSLVIPTSYNPALPHKWRLDAWFHGRGETLNEVNFLYDRQRQTGEFAPANTFVLHLYGRYCNANKFAGEVDLFEALEAVKRAYPIDEDRISVRGFSMGGAAAWHMAAHYAGEWAAAAPGAGFSETPEFLRMKPADIEATPWWERKLWHLYNATDHAANLSNVPVIAYSGEIDGQKQAADIMDRYMKEEGLALRHVIGPKTAHRYHPDSKPVIDGAMDRIVARGRESYPKRVRFVTYTLRYNRMKWVTVDALEKHWDKARIDAEVKDGREIHVKTANVRAFRLETEPGADLLDTTSAPAVVIDGQKLSTRGALSDGSWSAAFRRDGKQWVAGEMSGLRKQHGLQGPIDDAFMHSFLFVTPTGELSSGTASWMKAEQERAIREWRRQWRGEAPVKRDTEVTDEDIATKNLVVWGDPSSNKLLARMAAQMPLKWSTSEVALGSHKFGGSHVAIMVYPNPLNPSRYVVLNSGPTQREFDYLNNARQVPRLPDYAIVDTTTPPDARTPGKIVAAGFFDEKWQVQAGDGK